MAPTELPFLYQTRTILRLPLRRRSHTSSQQLSRPAWKRRISTQATGSKPTSTSFFREKAEELKSAHTSKTSTITRAEHRAFERIWRDILESKELEKEGGKPPSKSYNDTDPQRILAKFSNDIKGQQEERADNEALEESRGHVENTQSTIDALGRSQDVSDHAASSRVQDNILTFTPVSSSSFPPSPFENSSASDSSFHRPSFLTEVRHAEIEEAARLDGSVRPPFARVESPIKEADTGKLISPAKQYDEVVEVVAQREMDRFAAIFQTAVDSSLQATDVGIWNACRKHIFPLMELLESPNEHKNNKQGKQDETAAELKIKMTRKTKLIRNLPESPPYIPPLSIISRIYPASLLLALRLLARDTPTSPYALALLPQIRFLGPASYVLGGTTSFYNTLIKLYWDTYSDFKAIDKLLGEMERVGIEWDPETHQILVDIGEERWLDLQRPEGETAPRGFRGRAWWDRSMQVKWFDKVGLEWKRVIGARLREQGLGGSVSERDYESEGLLSGGTDRVSEGQQVVIL